MGPGELAAGLEVMILCDTYIALLEHGLGENSGPEELLPVAVRLLVLGPLAEPAAELAVLRAMDLEYFVGREGPQAVLV